MVSYVYNSLFMKKAIISIMLLNIFFLFLAGVFASCEKEDILSVGVSVGDLGNPFFVRMGKAARLQAQEIDPKAKVTVVSCNYDIGTQSNQIDDFIAAGVDLVIINPIDYDAMVPAIKRARDAGLVVVSVGDAVREGAHATVMTENVQAGELALEYLAQKIGGAGNIVIVNGPPVISVLDRLEGAKKALARYPNITVLSDNQNAGGNRDGGLRVMTDLLTAFPSVDAVFAINDPSGIGAALAIMQAQREDEMFVVAVDGSPDAEVELRNANSIFMASAAQFPHAMTVAAVQIGYNIMQGIAPEQETTFIASELITKDAVNYYKGWASE